MTALGIIPARGGSKGLPGKNLMRLGGQTLIERAIRSAREAHSLQRTLVSSDSPAILVEANGLCDVLIRPHELATDECGMIPVLQHAVRSVEAQGESYDLIVCLQPTSPFRTGQDIDECIALVTGKVESAQTLVVCPYDPRLVIIERLDELHHLDPHMAHRDVRRQDAPDCYIPSGAVYVTRRDVLMRGAVIGTPHRGLVRGWAESININTLWDFKIAEMILDQR